MQNFEILMKSVFSATILAILSLSFTAGIVQANKLSSHKGAWVDLGSTGIVFGTIAETVKKNGGPKGSVTYHIRRVNGREEFEELDSKKGLFALSLKPGLYEIYDWTVSGKPSRNIKIDAPVEHNRYQFEVRAGHLTYIGRIVTDIVYSKDEDGRKRVINQPYVTDYTQYDATLFSHGFPAFAKMNAIVAVRDNFVW